MKTYPGEIQELLDDKDFEICPQKYTKITTRQSQILEHVSLGKSNKEISWILDIHLKTVEKHKNRLREKLGLNSMAELVHFAIRNGITEKDEGICM
ncbi:response regulator transcription factor [Oceanispirochaeta sp. M1]|uniref:response regulator transcription factor n=1 Tax=Oceanispirochaeta sp. M1 TaxID=2283433 RepID=UPI00352CEB01